jgi:hypothetical protein
MPVNINKISNVDAPLARRPRHEEDAAALAQDEQNHAEEQTLQEMREAIGRQADKLDSAAGRQAEDVGLVTRSELEQMIAQHQSEMKAIMSVFEMFQKNDPRRGSPVSAESLEQDRLIQERTVKELQSSPREPVYIVPLPYEAQAIEQASGQPLYRLIVINNVPWPVKVGSVDQVPWQVAEVIRHAQEGAQGLWRQKMPQQNAHILWHALHPAQDIETIPRPPHQPGADAMGRSGVVSQDVYRPFTSSSPERLDVR